MKADRVSPVSLFCILPVSAPTFLHFERQDHMATIFSHPAVALGLFPWFRDVRNHKTILFAGAALTIVPDLDVLGMYAGVPFDHMLGHRGLSHSLMFAAFIAAIMTAIFSHRIKVNALAVWIYLFACTASHGVLDAFTNGGPGIAFFAPFSNQRTFFSFRPIEVSTLNIRYFFESQGAGVLANELVTIWPICLIVLLAGYVWQKRRSVQPSRG